MIAPLGPDGPGGVYACTALDTFMGASLAVHGPPTYLPLMIGRRVISGVLTLIAVQYAAVGAGSVCTADHAGPPPDASTQASHHDTESSSPTVPCTPGTQQPAPTHSSAGCLAMAGCTAYSVGGIAGSQVAETVVVAVRSLHTSTSLDSIPSAPETPPPIA